VRKTFHAYYPLPEKDIDALWKNGLIILDTNILINLYRWSGSTRDEFLKLLGGVNDRLWLPHRVAFEFHRQRLARIAEQRKAYDDGFLKPIDDVIAALESKRHPFVSAQFTKRLKTLHRDLKGELRKNVAELPASAKDAILDVITQLFDGRVGEAFTLDEMEDLMKEGAKRYNQKIPPGFSDIDKPEPERYGDLILWKQLLREARSRNVGVLFISDDTKKDWWRREDGTKIGLEPHPLLRDELTSNVQQPFHMYSSDRFMYEASKRLRQPVAKEAIQEARNALIPQSVAALSADDLVRLNHLSRLTAGYNAAAVANLAAADAAGADAVARLAGYNVANLTVSHAALVATELARFSSRLREYEASLGALGTQFHDQTRQPEMPEMKSPDSSPPADESSS